MPVPPSVLRLTEGLPLLALEPGEALFAPGDTATVAVLVEGALAITAGGVLLNRLDVPGSFVGEIGALLGQPRSAQVTADEPSVVRLIGDPIAFFGASPELGLELARQLAGRLHRLTSYVTDLRSQYAGSEAHLGLAGAVLGRLAGRPPVEVDPGSDRDAPDY